MKHVLIDANNLLLRTFFMNKNENESAIFGLAMHSAFTTLQKYYNKFHPDTMILAFDDKSWRKEYTASDKCLSKVPYKGTRGKSFTPAMQLKYAQFIEHIADLQNIIKNHTGVHVLRSPRLEADDLIAGFVQMHPDDEINIVSTDSDYNQLLKHPNVTIISPATGEPVSLADYFDDAEYYLFQKCIRGDMSSDNIPAAYPRVRSTEIRKAYLDAYTQTNFMNETWTDHNKITWKVKDRYEENKLLIDLEAQPPDIRHLMVEVINQEKQRPKKFSYFHFMNFLGKHKLKKLAESVSSMSKMLS